MNEEDRTVIIAECNFIEDLIYKIYVGSEEFTTVNRLTLHKRLQEIRKRVREHEI